jgi:hypothetical protein
MQRSRRVLTLAATLAVAAGDVAAAQTQFGQGGCPKFGGPLGIRGIHCVDCGVEAHARGTRWLFRSEPVVTQTIGGSAFRISDVIVAINDLPILSGRAGSLFSFPPPGSMRFTVRRDGETVTILLSVPEGCGPAEVRSVTPVRRIPERGAVAERMSGRSSEVIGLAVKCARCSLTRRDGVESYRFPVPPEVVALAPDGPAERAGIRIGDLIIEVDGLSILEDAGADRFGRTHGKDTIRLTVLRGGERRDHSVRLR